MAGKISVEMLAAGLFIMIVVFALFMYSGSNTFSIVDGGNCSPVELKDSQNNAVMCTNDTQCTQYLSNYGLEHNVDYTVSCVDSKCVAKSRICEVK